METIQVEKFGQLARESVVGEAPRTATGGPREPTDKPPRVAIAFGGKIYRGETHPNGRAVTVNGCFLRSHFEVKSYTVSGFDWGSDSAGTYQLALAILADYLGDSTKALQIHEDFARLALAKIEAGEWALTGEQIAAAVRVLVAADRVRVAATAEGIDA
jgi:hypothetical protein